MATTTNYSWTTPDDSALVKDGASAIRSLGTAIDTTTKNLNPSTTLGDIEYRSSTANTNTRLGIGTTGQVLTVSGGVPAWSTPAAGGGMTLLSTTTLSGTSTTVSSINGSYKHLFVEVYGAVWATGTASLQFELNTNNLSFKKFTGTSFSTSALQTTCNVEDGSQQELNTGGNNYHSFIFYNYASSTTYKTWEVIGGYESSTSTGRTTMILGAVSTNTAVNSFTFKNDGPYAFSAGTIKIYGVN